MYKLPSRSQSTNQPLPTASEGVMQWLLQD